MWFAVHFNHSSVISGPTCVCSKPTPLLLLFLICCDTISPICTPPVAAEFTCSSRICTFYQLGVEFIAISTSSRPHSRHRHTASRRRTGRCARGTGVRWVCTASSRTTAASLQHTGDARTRPSSGAAATRDEHTLTSGGDQSTRSWRRCRVGHGRRIFDNVVAVAVVRHGHISNLIECVRITVEARRDFHVGHWRC